MHCYFTRKENGRIGAIKSGKISGTCLGEKQNHILRNLFRIASRLDHAIESPSDLLKPMFAVHHIILTINLISKHT